MTQLWNKDGALTAGTVIKVYPNKVITAGEHKLAIASIDGKTSKPQAALAKAVDSKKGIWVKEIDNDADTLTVDQFTVGERVAISGTSKGKGFAGTIKRHNFHQGPRSHGSNNVRQPGSIGAQRPQRVPLGQKMAGHMGHEQVTVRGNKVLLVKPEEQIIVVTGAVPGPVKGKVIIQETNR